MAYSHNRLTLISKGCDKHFLSHLELESREGAEELASWKSVEGYWLSQPPTMCLHIIVKVSDTGE